MGDQSTQERNLTLQEIRKRELSKETKRRNRERELSKEAEQLRRTGAYLPQMIPQRKNPADPSEQAVYKAKLESYRRQKREHDERVKELHNRISDEAKKYNYPIENAWPRENCDELTYEMLMKWIALYASEKLCSRIGVLLVPIVNGQYIIYQAFLDHENKIIPNTDEILGKQLLANKLAEKLKELALKYQLLLIFDLQEEEIRLKEEISPFLENSSDEQVQQLGYEEGVSSKMLSFWQFLSMISGVIAYLLITIHLLSNGLFSRWLIVAVGIAWPIIVALNGKLSNNQSPKLLGVFRFAGNILISFSVFVTVLTLFSEFIPFSRVMNFILSVLWPISAGIFLIQVARPLSKRTFTIPVDAPFCENCLGSKHIECSICLGTGVIGEHIEQERKYQSMTHSLLKKRNAVIIFTLLQPVILSLVYIF